MLTSCCTDANKPWTLTLTMHTLPDTKIKRLANAETELTPSRKRDKHETSAQHTKHTTIATLKPTEHIYENCQHTTPGTLDPQVNTRVGQANDPRTNHCYCQRSSNPMTQSVRSRQLTWSMTGDRVQNSRPVYASEFCPAAQATSRLNPAGRPVAGSQV